MKFLLALALCLIQQAVCDPCGDQLRNYADCIETQLIPQPETNNFKAAASRCFRPSGCRSLPDLDYEEDEDGDATTECANQGLKVAAGPLVERCMARSYRGWTYETPKYTLIPGAPDTIIRMAINDIEDESVCPKYAVNATITCLDRAIKTHLPKPDTPQQTVAKLCQARTVCAAHVARSCLATESDRLYQACLCSNQLQYSYLPSSDATMEQCLAGYTDANIAAGVMRQYKTTRSTKPIDCEKAKKLPEC